MRKLLLLVGLSMLGVLLSASMALAQDDPCPDPDFPRETPDGCQASNLPDVPQGGYTSATPSATASPTASPGINTIAESCNDQPDPAGCKRQLRGAEGFGSATPSATASATASAASALPDTGGPVSVMALAPLALLVGSGILVFRLVRR